MASLNADVKKIELPVNLEVVNLRLPKDFPLTLCTWDYVPNRWFPSRTKEVLDDMARHGVNVFPRTIIPPGRVDAAGKLTIDWPVLDAELDRLDQRGKILFHLNHPPIEFAVKRTDEEKRPIELEYIRQLRDHLRERGRGYADYAFYLLDEPGLDNGPNVAILVDAGKLFREAVEKFSVTFLTQKQQISGSVDTRENSITPSVTQSCDAGSACSRPASRIPSPMMPSTATWSTT